MSGRIITARTARTAWNPGQKPPYGAKINPFHPLSQGLVGAWLLNEGGGNQVYDLIRNVALPLSGGAMMEGGGLLIDAADERAEVTTPPHLKINPPVCIACGVDILGTLSGYADFCGVAYNNTNDGLYNCYVLATNSDGTVYSLKWNNGSTSTDLDSIESITNGYHTIAGKFVNNDQVLYVDGKFVAYSEYALTTISYTATSLVHIGNHTGNSGRTSNSRVKYFYIWNRRLLDEEFYSLHANPYQMFWQPLYDSLGVEKHRGFVTKKTYKTESGIILQR